MEKVGRYRLNLTTGLNLAAPIMEQMDTMDLVRTEHYLFRKPDQNVSLKYNHEEIMRQTKLWDILQNRPRLFKTIDTMKNNNNKKKSLENCYRLKKIQ